MIMNHCHSAPLRGIEQPTTNYRKKTGHVQGCGPYFVSKLWEGALLCEEVIFIIIILLVVKDDVPLTFLQILDTYSSWCLLLDPYHLKLCSTVYENQEWLRVPDRKISVEGDILWHNPNRGVSRGLDVKASRRDWYLPIWNQSHSLILFSLNIDNKCILLAFLLLFDA